VSGLAITGVGFWMGEIAPLLFGRATLIVGRAAFTLSVVKANWFDLPGTSTIALMIRPAKAGLLYQSILKERTPLTATV
jgi:hypothetical protein